MPSTVYLSRMVKPMLDVFSHAIELDQAGLKSDLKYLILNLHDTNVSNFLRFLGYFEAHGYDKFVRFSSSVRIELTLTDSKAEKPIDEKYFVTFFYDDEKINFTFCKKGKCTFADFREFIERQLIDLEIAEAYCDGNMGEEYINELKHRSSGKQEKSV